MSDRSHDPGAQEQGAGGSLRMAALSLLLQQAMHRDHRLGKDAVARERLGHDLSAIFDGAFGGHAPPPGAPGGGHAGTAGSTLGKAVAGMDGLVQAFREHGLGREVESWLGDGPNLPVAPQQVAMVLDLREVDELARRFGTDRESLLRETAALLPEFVHRMTPHGALPRHEGEVPGGVGGLLRSLVQGGGAAGSRRG